MNLDLNQIKRFIQFNLFLFMRPFYLLIKPIELLKVEGYDLCLNENGLVDLDCC